jgi:predicted kinase
MPAEGTQLSNFLVFLIGRPGSGKSTFARYLTRALISTDVLYLNDYELLLARTETLATNQIKWEPNGQFEVLDRSVFEGLFSDLVKPIASNRGKRPIIVEFSRGLYVPTFAAMTGLNDEPFTIIYLDTPLESCIHRNAIRAPYNPLKTTPESVIRKYHTADDLTALLQAYPGNVRIVRNVDSSLHALEREASLILEDIVGTEHIKSLRPASHLTKEIMAAALLILYLIGFLFVSICAWRAGSSSFLASLLPGKDLNQLPFLKTILYVFSAGGLGSTTYCIRALYHYYIRGAFDFDRFKWWYLFRPPTGSVLAVSSFAIVKGGVVALGAGGSPPISSANLAWFGVAYLAGFGVEQVIEWLRRASKSVFGESRVQPDETGQG